MVLPNVYHRRKKLAEGANVDVWNYDHFPEKLRIQITREICSLMDVLKPNVDGEELYYYLNWRLKNDLGKNALTGGFF